MINTPKIRRFAPQEWNIYKDLRLRALADSPDAYCRTLAEEQDRSDAEWSSRLASGADSGWDLPLVAKVDTEPIGLAWGRIDRNNPDIANFFRLWVPPSHRRLGTGQMLLETAIAWASGKNVCYLDLGAAFDDSPAMRLYTRAGFEPVGAPQPIQQRSELLGQPMRLKLRSCAV